MTKDLAGLLLLHDLAAPSGGGLKPELLALLRREQAAAGQGAIPLGQPARSAGPARQNATAEQLAAPGIAVLGAARAARRRDTVSPAPCTVAETAQNTTLGTGPAPDPGAGGSAAPQERRPGMAPGRNTGGKP